MAECYNEPMNDRQEAILTCVVDHFIDSCQPISSAMVKDQLHIQLSPASVRQVFSVLDQQGYLEKLHTSSGGCQPIRGIGRMLIDWMPQLFLLTNMWIIKHINKSFVFYLISSGPVGQTNSIHCIVKTACPGIK